jgi:hypothetical protein
MGTSEKDVGQGDGHGGAQAPPRDLIDFYRRWTEFRPAAAALANRSDFSVSERQTLHWLIQLADRISEHDVEPVQPP